jgi:hypothetical protein
MLGTKERSTFIVLGAGMWVQLPPSLPKIGPGRKRRVDQFAYLLDRGWLRPNLGSRSLELESAGNKVTPKEAKHRVSMIANNHLAFCG